MPSHAETNANKLAQAREGITRFEDSEQSGRAWMIEQFDWRLPDSTICGVKQAMYEGKWSIKELMLSEADEAICTIIKAVTFRNNHPREYEQFNRDCRANKRHVNREGRVELDATDFPLKIEAMARHVLTLDKNRHWISAAVLALAFGITARLNEVDPTCSKRKDGHRNTKNDFEVSDDWTVVQHNGSKWVGGPRETVRKACMLPPDLLRALIDYVYDWDEVDYRFELESWSVSSYVKQPVARNIKGKKCGWPDCKKCDGSNIFKHLLAYFNIHVTELEMHFTPYDMREAAASLFPYLYDVSGVNRNPHNAVVQATRVQLNHADGSSNGEGYTAVSVINPPEPPTKKVRLDDEGIQVS